MKLLVVAPYFYPKIGGLENYAWHITKGLKEKFGWTCVVITSNHLKNVYKEETIEGIKIYRLPTLIKLSNTPINPLWFIAIRKILEKEKSDIINAHSPVPFIADITALVAQQKNIPFVLTYHAGSMLKGKKLLDFIINIYEKTILKWLFKNSKLIVITSVNKIPSILTKYANKIINIPPGIDPKLFKPLDTEKKTQNKVLYVGKIDKSAEWKGISYLLEAVKISKASVTNIHLNLVGTGNAINFYKEYAEKLGIKDNVTFIGEVRGEKLVEEYQKANVLVLPSTTNAESFGMVLIEAMATGVPVIASRIGGIPDVIMNEKEGLLVEPKNSRKLADAIKSLLNNPGKRKLLIDEGLQKVKKNFSWNIQINKFNTILYENI